MTPLAFVEGEGLACARGGRVVFRDVGFHLAGGKALVVEGPNGSGKTSLLRLIAGLLPAASGTLRVSIGDDVVEDREVRGKFVAWLGHHDSVKPQLTPRETLQHYRKLYTNSTLPLREGGTERGPDIEAMLGLVALSRAADIPSQYLSAGQKKRLALARLKLCGRPLWLLDEPLAALDAEAKSLLLTLLREHLAAGGIAVIATHDALDLEAGRLQLA